MCVVSVTVKRPVLPPSAVDGCYRNPLYYYFSLFACLLLFTTVAVSKEARGPPCPQPLPLLFFPAEIDK